MESNVIARQPRRAPHQVIISFSKHRRLASEGLVNLTGDTGRELRSVSTTRQVVIHYSTLLP